MDPFDQISSDESYTDEEKRALAEAEALIEQGHPEQALGLLRPIIDRRKCKLAGLHIQVGNYHEAISELDPLINRNTPPSPEASRIMGSLYAEGLGVKKDLTKAGFYYRLAELRENSTLANAFADAGIAGTEESRATPGQQPAPQASPEPGRSS